MKTGIIVGSVGSILSLLFIGILDWIIYSFNEGFDFLLFLEYLIFLLYYYGIFYVLVGLIVGYLFGNSYKKREIVEKRAPLL